MNRHGYSLLEVLIALVLISIALLGLAGLQIRAQQAEIEAYQRTQAMLLVNDMIDRIGMNRDARRCYVTEDAMGSDYTLGTDNAGIPACNAFGSSVTQARANTDMAAWDGLLKGVSETAGGNNVGGLVGARGCINYQPEQAGPPVVPETITVIVAWQGEVETGAPTTNNCATGLYGSENLRRTASDTVRFAELD